MNIQHAIHKLLGLIAFIGISIPVVVGAEPSVTFKFGNHIDTHHLTTLN